MTRKKVKLAYITNDSARKATFKKRKKGLLKKVSELSTLCDIQACAIVYSPYDAQPEVWPNAAGAHRVLSKFRDMPEMEQSKKMVNQESFLKQRLAKAKDQLKKQHKDNREKEIACLMYRALIGNTSGAGKGPLSNLSMVDLNDLGWLIDQNLKDIHSRVESLRSKEGSSPNSCRIGQQQQQMASGAATAMAAAEEEMAKLRRQQETSVQEEKAAAAVAAAAAGMSGVVMESGNNNMGVNVEAMQKHQWLMDLLNSNDHMGFGGVGVGEEMMMPFGVDGHGGQAGLWSTAFFP